MRRRAARSRVLQLVLSAGAYLFPGLCLALASGLIWLIWPHLAHLLTYGADGTLQSCPPLPPTPPRPRQELDPAVMVIWDGFDKVPWRYLDMPALRAFLIDRVHDGYAFPLNPKWVLCDGWYDVFAALMATPHAQARQCVDAWFPLQTGVRQTLDRVHAQYPNGLPSAGPGWLGGDNAPLDSRIAELRLRRHIVYRRARVKLRALLFFTMAGTERRQRLALGSHAVEEAALAAT